MGKNPWKVFLSWIGGGYDAGFNAGFEAGHEDGVREGLRDGHLRAAEELDGAEAALAAVRADRDALDRQRQRTREEIGKIRAALGELDTRISLPPRPVIPLDRPPNRREHMPQLNAPALRALHAMNSDPLLFRSGLDDTSGRFLLDKLHSQGLVTSDRRCITPRGRRVLNHYRDRIRGSR